MNVISLVKEVDTNKVIACLWNEEKAYDLRRRLAAQKTDKQYMVEQRCVITRKYTVTYSLCNNIVTPIVLSEGPIIEGKMGENTIDRTDNKIIVRIAASDIKYAVVLANSELKKLGYKVEEV